MNLIQCLERLGSGHPNDISLSLREGQILRTWVFIMAAEGNLRVTFGLGTTALIDLSILDSKIPGFSKNLWYLDGDLSFCKQRP